MISAGMSAIESSGAYGGGAMPSELAVLVWAPVLIVTLACVIWLLALIWVQRRGLESKNATQPASADLRKHSRGWRHALSAHFLSLL